MVSTVRWSCIGRDSLVLNCCSSMPWEVPSSQRRPSRPLRKNSVPDTADGSLIRLFVDHQLSVSWAKSHGENDTKLSLAAHHVGIRLCCFFQWVGFDHRAHAPELGKVQRIFRSGRRSCSPPVN